MPPNKNKYVIPIIESTVRDFAINPVLGQALLVTKAIAISPDKNSPNYQNSIYGAGDYDLISLLGTPIFDTITLRYENANYSGSNASVISSDISLDYTFQTVQFVITQTRNIVTTPINGLNGTIKEFIADGDYIINCNANIVFNGMDYIDYQLLQNIQTLFQVQDTIQIESKIINNIFNINNVVLKDYKFTQPQVGMRNIQNISFSLLSDNPNNYNIIF